MKRSRNEVARWRMRRQAQWRKTRRHEAQARCYRSMQRFHYQVAQRQRRSILFVCQH
ncbi:MULTISPECIES: YciY family protein [unclassified Erwinia]|uniref:YciY family protein n=1 Tax=unclassified Erwinia TaxID=2622719 RepID=UPI000C177AA4|nr:MULTISPECIES: YciY family protein [unclassified Erwinia]